MKKLFTSEQVSMGHPDKICDQIADSILDVCLSQDKSSRIAIEVLIKNYDVIIGGEVTTSAKFDIEEIVKSVLLNIGISDYMNYKITNLLDKQSPDISMGVDTGGAGDQGIMFGYATNETNNFMPIAYSLATKALINLRELKSPILLPDAKSQVTIEYIDEKPNRIDTFLISSQHTEDAKSEEIYSVIHDVMIKTAEEFGMNTDFKVLINPTGRFVIGGSMGDAGVTGRKIICDTYGGYAHHGGGAFSGKDPSKVDRSAAYIARKIAKDIVRNNMADKCEIQLSYAIGVAKPISIFVDCFNTNKICIQDIQNYIEKNYDLTPKGIISYLDLLNVRYSDTSTYGHFSKDYLPWEK